LHLFDSIKRPGASRKNSNEGLHKLFDVLERRKKAEGAAFQVYDKEYFSVKWITAENKVMEGILCYKCLSYWQSEKNMIFHNITHLHDRFYIPYDKNELFCHDCGKEKIKAA